MCAYVPVCAHARARACVCVCVFSCGLGNEGKGLQFSPQGIVVVAFVFASRTKQSRVEEDMLLDIRQLYCCALKHVMQSDCWVLLPLRRVCLRLANLHHMDFRYRLLPLCKVMTFSDTY